MRGFFWLLAAIGSLIGILVAVETIMEATSAPQQAAGFSHAVAWAVPPYVLARAVESFSPRRVELVTAPASETKTSAAASDPEKDDTAGW